MSNQKNILNEEKKILREERKIFKEVKKEGAALSRISKNLKKITKRSNFIFLIFILVLASIFIYYFWSLNQPGDLDNFAACLGKKGATFYGAFWCPHCQNQKRLFGNSARLLPYVECSTPDQNGQLQICIDKKITGYPTWEFADGTRLSGEVTLQDLAEKTGCSLQSGVNISSSGATTTSVSPTS